MLKHIFRPFLDDLIQHFTGHSTSILSVTVENSLRENPEKAGRMSSQTSDQIVET